MATSSGQDRKANCTSDVDLLLHPELLSQEFLKQILSERRVSTRDSLSRDQLTALYLQHLMPLPQRTLPSSRWGKKVARTRGGHAPSATHSSDPNRKRALIAFDGSSSNSGSPKVKRSEGNPVSARATDRLKPPPAANLASSIGKLSANTSSSTSSKQTADLKKEALIPSPLNSPEDKKKIQPVTWP